MMSSAKKHPSNMCPLVKKRTIFCCKYPHQMALGSINTEREREKYTWQRLRRQHTIKYFKTCYITSFYSFYLLKLPCIRRHIYVICTLYTIFFARDMENHKIDQVFKPNEKDILIKFCRYKNMGLYDIELLAPCIKPMLPNVF